jgi:hypothetical protein
MNLEEVWRIREEQVYPSLFVGTGRGIFTFIASHVSGTLQAGGRGSAMAVLRRLRVLAHGEATVLDLRHLGTL